jgi:hypothetical protein
MNITHAFGFSFNYINISTIQTISNPMELVINGVCVDIKFGSWNVINTNVTFTDNTVIGSVEGTINNFIITGDYNETITFNNLWGSTSSICYNLFSGISVIFNKEFNGCYLDSNTFTNGLAFNTKNTPLQGYITKNTFSGGTGLNIYSYISNLYIKDNIFEAKECILSINNIVYNNLDISGNIWTTTDISVTSMYIQLNKSNTVNISGNKILNNIKIDLLNTTTDINFTNNTGNNLTFDSPSNQPIIDSFNISDNIMNGLCFINKGACITKCSINNNKTNNFTVDAIDINNSVFSNNNGQIINIGTTSTSLCTKNIITNNIIFGQLDIYAKNSISSNSISGNIIATDLSIYSDKCNQNSIIGNVTGSLSFDSSMLKSVTRNVISANSITGPITCATGASDNSNIITGNIASGYTNWTSGAWLLPGTPTYNDLMAFGSGLNRKYD